MMQCSSLSKPRITGTFWEGASPYEIESEIVREQEDELKAVDGLVEMTSESQDSSGTIVLEFEIGTDIESAVVDVSNKLNQVPDYPDEVEQPVISTTDVTSTALAWFMLKPVKGNDADIYSYYDFADDYIKPAFERVTGVGSSNVFGGYEREMQVIVDPNALAVRASRSSTWRALRRERQLVGDFEGQEESIVRAVSGINPPKI
jgi:HAE1 family hydrophobic/amphiphilic exporter-1